MSRPGPHELTMQGVNLKYSNHHTDTSRCRLDRNGPPPRSFSESLRYAKEHPERWRTGLQHERAHDCRSCHQERRSGCASNLGRRSWCIYSLALGEFAGAAAASVPIRVRVLHWLLSSLELWRGWMHREETLLPTLPCARIRLDFSLRRLRVRRTSLKNSCTLSTWAGARTRHGAYPAGSFALRGHSCRARNRVQAVQTDITRRKHAKWSQRMVAEANTTASPSRYIQIWIYANA